MYVPFDPSQFDQQKETQQTATGTRLRIEWALLEAKIDKKFNGKRMGTEILHFSTIKLVTGLLEIEFQGLMMSMVFVKFNKLDSIQKILLDYLIWENFS